MQCISSAVNKPSTRDVIARQGSDTIFVEYRAQPFGQLVLLIAELVGCLPISQATTRYEIGRKIVGEEDAVNAACDLEWDAADELESLLGHRGTKDAGIGFAEAVELLLDARAAALATAAE
ncbi:hypothetical protein JL101_036300 (plasmid) [Skermanella rosea]|uniref:hypothetical protein n=1 Tax=Skermanella rosea TaxID=1817965 RepID=UPI0019345013|nr:hypothetical protein [Skermanella rosea]UEM08158.1 hypothetical protein JL101_036300 [Skermanella rosea]